VESVEYGNHPPRTITLNALDDVLLGNRARVLRAVDKALGGES
jgi:hypothetical protein